MASVDSSSNSLFPVGGTTWKGVEGMAFLREECHGGVLGGFNIYIGMSVFSSCCYFHVWVLAVLVIVMTYTSILSF